jgi:diguanylate cyclase (GGDEF)-like protein
VHGVTQTTRKGPATRLAAGLPADWAELQATLESTADGILVTDLAGRIRNFNRRFACLWELPAPLQQARDDDAVFEWMRRSVADPAAYMRDLALVEAQVETDIGSESADVAPRRTDQLALKSGRVLERSSLPQRSRGSVIGRVFCVSDVTERVRACERIEQLSHTDALTGLANRLRLFDRLGSAIALARRDATPFALLLVNLDRFARLNETLGHAHGDTVLREVAQRLGAGLRGIDTVARNGGDEFAVLVQQAEAVGAAATARRILEAMQRPFEHAGLSFTVTASIGIALHPADGSDPGDLLRGADAAMREAKQAGRANYRFHAQRGSREDELLRHRLQLDHGMRQALTQGHLRLHYQPQVDLQTGRVCGAEALIRWTDPERGEISPGEFIPVAEASGFIVAIGDWVLREAVRQAVEWRARGLCGVMGVNVSAVQFLQPGFVERVIALVTESGLEPAALELELTESLLVSDEREALLRLDALARFGVKLAIDDFGTGFSSLGYLKRFPIGRLKIDRSFIQGLPGDASDAGIVNAIVQMGRALRLEVIAEGVETDAQRRFLAEAGCAQFQGFLFAPAVGAAEFERRWGGAAALPARTDRIH